MKPVVKIRGPNGKLYTPTLPLLPDEILVNIAEKESIIKPSILKNALYHQGFERVNKGNSNRRTSLVRRKLSKLKL